MSVSKVHLIAQKLDQYFSKEFYVLRKSSPSSHYCFKCENLIYAKKPYVKVLKHENVIDKDGIVENIYTKKIYCLKCNTSKHNCIQNYYKDYIFTLDFASNDFDAKSAYPTEFIHDLSKTKSVVLVEDFDVSKSSDESKSSELFPNFSLVATQENKKVFANDICKSKCPELALINDKYVGCGSILIAFVQPDKVLFVNDGTMFTNVQGWKELNESYEDCANREFKEETGLNIEFIPIKWKEIKKTTILYDLTWDNYVCLYYTIIDEQTAMQAVNFKSKEIKEVSLFDISYLKQINISKNYGMISPEHVNYVLEMHSYQAEV